MKGCEDQQQNKKETHQKRVLKNFCVLGHKAVGRVRICARNKGGKKLRSLKIYNFKKKVKK